MSIRITVSLLKDEKICWAKRFRQISLK